MFTPAFDANIGAVAIVGSTDGNSQAPQNPGVMLHATGTQSTPSRIYNDAVGSYSAMVGRRYNGNVNAPTQVLANSIVSRYAATPYTSNGWPAISTARIDMVTTEDQTDTNQGTEIQFWTTTNGTNTIAQVMSVTNNDIRINGDLAATGNATFSTNIDYVNHITVSGTTYDAQIVIDDIGANNVAQLILTRSSTSVQPIIASALNNSDDPTANVDVVNGQTLFQLATLGFAGTDYKEFAGIVMMVDDNANVSETSSPGKIDFRVTPDGSTSTESALTIYNNTNAEFAGNISTTGNIIGAYLWGDGSNISNISGVSANTIYNGLSNVTIPVANGNVTVNTNAGTDYPWTFGTDGELYLPSGGRLGFAGKGWTGLDGGNGAPVSLTSFYANGFYAGCITNNNDGNIIISTYTGNGLQGSWTFDNGANLVLAPTNLGTGGAGSGEAAKFRGTRRIVGGYTNSYAYSTVLNAGGTPTVAYTATDSSVQSARVTFAVQGSSNVWEQFDVVVVQTVPQGNVNFTVSNRVKASDTPDTVVSATWNGTAIEISLNLDASQLGGGWASFDAVEFGLMAG